MTKILIITYYFPPCGGASVQRWLRFIPLLVQNGYDVSVLTTKNGDYPLIDTTLCDKIPAEVNVIRTFTPSLGGYWKMITGKKESLPYGSLDASNSTSIFKKAIYWARLNLIYPDIRIIWNPLAGKTALRLCREKGFDWVITTGPPHSTHLIGLFLKRKIRINWLADFRDPWTKIFYLKMNPQNRLITLLNKRLEQQVVKTADINLVISHAISNELPNGKKQVLYNGFDAKQFELISYKRDQYFRIKFIGQLTEGQNIEGFLRFLADFIKTNNADEIRFTFVGTKAIRQTQFAIDVNISEFMPHDKALNEIVNSELLILLINDYKDNQGMLTTKLFEYVASGTPILCIGPLDGEAANIISISDTGKTYSSIDNGMAAYLGQLYAAWKTGEPVRNDHDISQWSVQQQVKQLVSLLSCN